MLPEALHVLWGRVGMAGCRVLALVALARILDPADLGRFSFLVVAYVVFTQLTSMGTEVAATVLVAEDHEGARRWTAPLLAVSVVYAAVSALLFLVVMALAGSILFEGVPGAALNALLVSLLPGQIVIAMRGVLTGEKRFAAVSSLSMLQWGGYLVAVIVWAVAGGSGLLGAVRCFVLSVWISALAALAVTLPAARRGMSTRDAASVVSLGARSHLAQVLNFLQLRLDMIVLRVLAAPEQLGYYSVATNLSEWLLYLPRALGTVAMPRSARKEGVADDVFGWQFALMLGGATLVFVLAPWLVALFFGSQYGPAVVVLRLLLPGTVLLGHGTLAMGILFGRRDIAFLVKSGLAVVVAFVVLDLWLVPPFGARGAAGVSSLLYTLYSVALTARLFAGRPRSLAHAFVPRRRRSEGA